MYVSMTTSTSGIPAPSEGCPRNMLRTFTNGLPTFHASLFGLLNVYYHIELTVISFRNGVKKTFDGAVRRHARHLHNKLYLV
jgi:hypothetical protein